MWGLRIGGGRTGFVGREEWGRKKVREGRVGGEGKEA